MATLWLTDDDAANLLLTEVPLALLIGMLLDQQIPLERAFAAPRQLRTRLGTDLDARVLAEYDPDALVTLFREPPALHRYPRSMAERVQALCRLLVERYDGDAAALWQTAADGDSLLRRVRELPGFGEQKTKIFVALLGKQLGVRPPGWREAAGEFGSQGSTRSVADITSPETLEQVRAYKQQLKAARRDGGAPPG